VPRSARNQCPDAAGIGAQVSPEYAVGEATASCPVPPTDGTVTFAFARNEDAREPPPNAIPLRLIY